MTNEEAAEAELERIAVAHIKKVARKVATPQASVATTQFPRRTEAEDAENVKRCQAWYMDFRDKHLAALKAAEDAERTAFV